MTTPNGPPLPSRDPIPGPPGTIDPETGSAVPFADRRAEFERLSRRVPRDPVAERAFLESKVEMIRTDPHLTEAEKQRAIDQLRPASPPDG